MTNFALLIIDRQEVEWIGCFYTSHPYRDRSNGQKTRLDIETANNFEAVLFQKQAKNAGNVMDLKFFMPSPPAFIIIIIIKYYYYYHYY